MARAAQEPRAFEGLGPDARYLEFLSRGEFRVQRCHACRRHFFVPRLLCPHCGSLEVEWTPVSGEATVYSTSVVRRPPERGGPYNVAIVALAEGPHLMTQVRTIDPEAVRIGMSVRSMIVTEDGATFVVFAPVGTGA